MSSRGLFDEKSIEEGIHHGAVILNRPSSDETIVDVLPSEKWFDEIQQLFLNTHPDSKNLVVFTSAYRNTTGVVPAAVTITLKASPDINPEPFEDRDKCYAGEEQAKREGALSLNISVNSARGLYNQLGRVLRFLEMQLDPAPENTE